MKSPAFLSLLFSSSLFFSVAAYATNHPSPPPPDKNNSHQGSGSNTPSSPNSSSGSCGDEEGNPCDKEDDDCDPDPPSCIREAVSIPIAPNEPALGKGKLQLYINATDTNLASLKFLEFYGIPQMALTDIHNNGDIMTFKTANAGGELIPFAINKTSTDTGFPIGNSAFSQARVHFVNASGNVSNYASAASIRQYRGTNGFVDYPVSGGDLKKYITQQGREYVFPMPGVEMIRLDSSGNLRVNAGYDSGTIRQVKTLAGLLDVVSLSERSYEIREYKAEQVGPKEAGLYTALSAPVFSMKVEAPTGTTNQLFITHTSGSSVIVTQHDCQASQASQTNQSTQTESHQSNSAPSNSTPSDSDHAASASNESWKQTIVSGDLEYYRDLARGPLAEYGPTYRSETRTAKLTKTPAGISIVPATPQYSYKSINIGYRPVSLEQKFSTGKVRSQSLSYEKPSWDAEGTARRKSQETDKGSSYGYDYKDDGRMTKRDSNRSKDDSSGGKSPSTKSEGYDYTPLSQGEALNPADFRPRKTQIIEDGIVVGVEYFSAFQANDSYIERKETSSQITAAFGDPANRFSETAWYGSGVHKGRMKYSLDDSGALTRYEYAALPNNGLQTITFSDLDRTGNPVAGHSTRTTESNNVRGLATEITRAAWTGSAWLDYETLLNSYDVRGNLTQRDRRDPISNTTRTLLVQEWDGTRRTRMIDEQGIETLYTYYAHTKHLKDIRRLTVPASGDFPAQPEILTTYTGTFTINEKQEPEWSTRIATTTAGSLSLTETEVFDEKGRVTSHTDQNGLITTTLYSTDDLTTTITQPDGGTITTKKDSDGRTLSVTGSAVVPRFYHYQPRTGGGEITTVFIGTDNGSRYEKTITDSAGRVLEMSQPAFGGSASSVSSYAYATGDEQRTSPIRISRSGYASEIRQYNPIGQLHRRGSSADDLTLTPASATDRVSDVEHVFEQDASGFWQVTRSYTYPTASSAVRKLTSTSRVKLGGFSGTEISRSEQIDLLGNKTITFETLDGAVQTMTTQHAAASDPQIATYHAERMMTLQQPGITSALVMGYDALGREVSRKDPRHATTASISYIPEKNQIASQTDAAGNTTSFTYYPQGAKGAGNLRSTQLPDGSVSYQAYTQRGELMASWGSQTNPTWREYNALGEMTALHTWQNNPNLSVDALPASIPAGSAKTSWNYDPATGLLLSKRDAADKGASYTYDIASRLATRTWARGIITSYSYNTFGQLVATDYSDTTPDVSLTYDRLGRQVTQSSLVSSVSQSSVSYSYNPENLQIDTETITYNLPGQAAFTRVIDRKQDTLLRESGYSLGSAPAPGAPGGASPPYEQEVSYAYSPTDGRMETVGSPAGNFTYTYEPNSHLIKTITSPAHTVENTYEPNRDVLAVKQNKVGSTEISRYQYGVNSIGQRTSLAQTGSAFASARDITWGYDGLGQVTSAASTIPGLSRAYQFDMIGNRLQGSEGVSPASVTNYTANALNQYTSIGSVNPVHDLDGNATAYPLPANLSANSTLTWDGENRLIQATIGTTGSLVRYSYDAQSRRIAETIGASTKLTIYDVWNPIAEWTADLQSASFTLAKSFTWGIDLSGTMQGAGGVGGLLMVTVGSPGSGDRYFPTYDGNGNVSEYLDSTGTIAAHYEYDPFGKTTVATGPKAQDFAHRFSTKPLDEATGLYYYGYRFYDPNTGRWPSRDPIEEMGGVNLYAFVGNDGVNMWDYLGLAYTAKKCAELQGKINKLLRKAQQYQDQIAQSERQRSNIKAELAGVNAEINSIIQQMRSNSSLVRYFSNHALFWGGVLLAPPTGGWSLGLTGIGGIQLGMSMNQQYPGFDKLNNTADRLGKSMQEKLNEIRHMKNTKKSIDDLAENLQTEYDANCGECEP